MLEKENQSLDKVRAGCMAPSKSRISPDKICDKTLVPTVSHSFPPLSPPSLLLLSFTVILMVVNVAIVGVGLVGSEFISQVLKTQSNKIAIIAVANRRQMLTSTTPLTASWKEELLKGATTNPFTLDAFTASLAASKASHPTVVLDCTADDVVAAYYPTWIEAGFHIVTPNKRAFSSDLALYKKIKELSSKPGSPLVYHESTVGAGLPVISTLNDLINTGDKIIKIEGIFSGTLAYIFNNFSTLDAQTGTPKFSDIVKGAKANGYTVGSSSLVSCQFILEKWAEHFVLIDLRPFPTITLYPGALGTRSSRGLEWHGCCPQGRYPWPCCRS